MPDGRSLPQGTAVSLHRFPRLTQRPIIMMSLLLGLPVVGMIIFGAGLLVPKYWLLPAHSEPQALLQSPELASLLTPPDPYASSGNAQQKHAPPANTLPPDGLQSSPSEPALSTAEAATPPQSSMPSDPGTTQSLKPNRPPQPNKSEENLAGLAPSPTTTAHFEPDAEGWYAIQNSRTPLDFAEFLEVFPSSRFAADARARLRQFQCQPYPSSADNMREPAHPYPTEAQPIPSPSPSSVTRMQVRYAQLSLRLAGFDPGPIDGICGVRTLAALRQYQESRDIPVTGTLDTPTQQALQIPSHTVLTAWQQSRQNARTLPVMAEQSRERTPQAQQRHNLRSSRLDAQTER